MTLAQGAYDFLGYKDNPIKGLLMSAAPSALLGAAIYSLINKDALRGAALGAGAGTLLTSPLLMRSITEHGKAAPQADLETQILNDTTIMPTTKMSNLRKLGFVTPSFLDSPVPRFAMQNAVNTGANFHRDARFMMARILDNAADRRKAEDLMANEPKGYLTIGDLVRAGVNAGLGAGAGFTVGTMLGFDGGASAGGMIGGALSIGHSLGMVR